MEWKRTLEKAARMDYNGVNDIIRNRGGFGGKMAGGGHRRIGFACQVSITRRNSVAAIE